MALFISSCETDFLDRGIVKTCTTDKDAGSTNLWSKIRLDSFNGHVVVAEINWFASKLLPVQSNINRVYHILWVIALKFRHFSNNFAIFIEPFSTRPCVVLLIELESGTGLTSLFN